MDSNTALFAGALDQLMRHSLTGCGQAAHQAARLLERLSECADLDHDTRGLCVRMCDKLEAGMGVARG
ncbi:MAG TPA: hypothetical protein PKH69_05605 [Thiobacillaceae bacterium]|nr:hypothetical protein [Thiobacillaceae bacterium]HNU64183.1 hypothetical protein [Thiobacillaceae bacterium]